LTDGPSQVACGGSKNGGNLRSARGPVSVTVTSAFVNDDAPRVPETVDARLYVIGSAWTGATEQDNAIAPVYNARVILMGSSPRPCHPLFLHLSPLS